MTIDFHDKAIGVAVTGSFCTFRQVFEELESLAQTGASLYTIFSDNAYHTNLIPQTIQQALNGKQIHPVIRSPYPEN